MEAFEDYNVAKRHLLEAERGVFCLDGMLQDDISYEQASKILELMHEDSAFLLLDCENRPNSWRFISFERLVNTFIELNLRPSGIFSEFISPRHLRHFIRMKLGFDANSNEMASIVKILSQYGLIVPAASGFSLAINHLLKYIKRLKGNEEYKILSGHIMENHRNASELPNNLFSGIQKEILSITATLKAQEQEVLSLRFGLEGRARLSKRQTGSHLGVTGSRILQIENTCFKRLRHPSRIKNIKSLYYHMLIANRGSILLPEDITESDFSSAYLILEVLDVPYALVDRRLIIGASYTPDNYFDDAMLWNRKLDPQLIRQNLSETDCWWVGDKDIGWLAKSLVRIVGKKQRKVHRTYIALEALGRPSHYSLVVESHNEIFPKYENSEHNIHTALCMYPEHFVWTGVLGTYALPEWGYERAKMTLMETCHTIIRDHYDRTGNPVDYSVVQSRIHEHRKLVNPNSLFFAAYFNPAVNVTEDRRLVPKDQHEVAFIDTEEDYGTIERDLKEFEKHLI